MIRKQVDIVKRSLVIVRAGDTSLHPYWLTSNFHEEWDLVVSYYGSSPTAFMTDGYRRIDHKGSKLVGLKLLLEEHPQLMESYDYFFFPDDDLEMSGKAIADLFYLCSQYHLGLAQPSLTSDSYVSRLITIHNPDALLRFTPWIECMAPCFSREALRLCLPTFGESLTGWGVDNLWAHILGTRNIPIAIVDAVQARHTRPYGGPNYGHVYRAGTTAYLELMALQDKHSIRQPLLKNIGAIRNDGSPVPGDQMSNDERWIVPPW
jgi:hypothetical protein